MVSPALSLQCTLSSARIPRITPKGRHQLVPRSSACPRSVGGSQQSAASRSCAEVTVKQLAPRPLPAGVTPPAPRPRPRALPAPQPPARPPRSLRAPPAPQLQPQPRLPGADAGGPPAPGPGRRDLPPAPCFPATLCPFTRVSELKLSAKPGVRAARGIALHRGCYSKPETARVPLS